MKLLTITTDDINAIKAYHSLVFIVLTDHINYE